MMLWLVAFVVLRAMIWRMGLWCLGQVRDDMSEQHLLRISLVFCIGIPSEAELSASAQAAFTLFLDCGMLWATIGIISKSLERFKPFQRKDIFPWSFRGRKVWITLLAACALIPLVDWLGTHMTVRLRRPRHIIMAAAAPGSVGLVS